MSVKLNGQNPKRKIPVKLIISALLVILIIVFAAVNAENVRVNFIFGYAEFPLVLIILGSALIGALIMLGFSYFKRK
ncbi:LapA family protein [Listeria costaricensis]|uniref:LapA family protein n=1 Tax=Listeria costaricensis TaxID=2026604 RepID=UPI000C06D30D|nr:lipopolysaccharide assembly protein LapA domain-containing protein [Listeria costaricensis]